MLVYVLSYRALLLIGGIERGLECRYYSCVHARARTHTHTHTHTRLKRTNNEYSEEMLRGYGKQTMMLMKSGERGRNFPFHLCHV